MDAFNVSGFYPARQYDSISDRDADISFQVERNLNKYVLVQEKEKPVQGEYVLAAISPTVWTEIVKGGMRMEGGITLISHPEPEWKFCFAGDWNFTVFSKTAPHWLARFLMKWLLDIHWARNKKEA